jgi:hypothetical protein
MQAITLELVGPNKTKQLVPPIGARFFRSINDAIKTAERTVHAPIIWKKITNQYGPVVIRGSVLNLGQPTYVFTITYLDYL